MQKSQLLRKIFFTCIGVLMIGTGISLCVYAGYGTDPCTCLNLGISGRTGLPFWLWSLIFNALVLLLPAFLDRAMIGFGTVFNMVFCGIIADALRSFYATFLPRTQAAPAALRIALLLIGTAVIYAGAAMYIIPGMGASPYDSIALLLAARTPVDFQWCRILCDASALLIGWLFGSTVGFGTVLLALSGGPLMKFFLALFRRTFFPDEPAIPGTDRDHADT